MHIAHPFHSPSVFHNIVRKLESYGFKIKTTLYHEVDPEPEIELSEADINDSFEDFDIEDFYDTKLFGLCTTLGEYEVNDICNSIVNNTDRSDLYIVSQVDHEVNEDFALYGEFVAKTLSEALATAYTIALELTVQITEVKISINDYKFFTGKIHFITIEKVDFCNEKSQLSDEIASAFKGKCLHQINEVAAQLKKNPLLSKIDLDLGTHTNNRVLNEVINVDELDHWVSPPIHYTIKNVVNYVRQYFKAVYKIELKQHQAQEILATLFGLDNWHVFKSKLTGIESNLEGAIYEVMVVEDGVNMDNFYFKTLEESIAFLSTKTKNCTINLSYESDTRNLIISAEASIDDGPEDCDYYIATNKLRKINGLQNFDEILHINESNVIEKFEEVAKYLGVNVNNLYFRLVADHHNRGLFMKKIGNINFEYSLEDDVNKRVVYIMLHTHDDEDGMHICRKNVVDLVLVKFVEGWVLKEKSLVGDELIDLLEYESSGKILEMYRCTDAEVESLAEEIGIPTFIAQLAKTTKNDRLH